MDTTQGDLKRGDTPITREDVEKLKREWMRDPCYDLVPSSPGIWDEYLDELRAYQDEMGRKWESARVARLKQFAAYIGAGDNLTLAETIRELEYRISKLEEKE